jgi:glutamine amidotransferase
MYARSVCILDYGSGNVKSVFNALRTIGCNVQISNSPEIMANASHLILPGVGSYEKAMEKINLLIPLDALYREVQIGKPVLGICVGMQVFSSTGREFGNWNGLDLIKNSEVSELNTELSLPHVGWNSVAIKKKHKFLDSLSDNPDFYFVHGYAYSTIQSENILASCDYGITFPAVISQGNLIGTQFHPEKSQKNGLKVLTNFVEWLP